MVERARVEPPLLAGVAAEELLVELAADRRDDHVFGGADLVHLLGGRRTLLSIGAGKQEMVRVQGVVFLLGAAMLTASHLTTGVLNGVTLPLSGMLVVPASCAIHSMASSIRTDPSRV